MSEIGSDIRLIWMCAGLAIALVFLLRFAFAWRERRRDWPRARVQRRRR